MITSRVTPPVEEGVEVEGTIEATGPIVFARGHFDRSWASLRRTELASMATMVVYKGEARMGIEKWQRIRVIAEGNMSLSWVAES